MRKLNVEEEGPESEAVTLDAELGPGDLEDVVALLEHEYWNASVSRELIADAHRGSGAWVGARDRNGRVVASARAI